MRNKRRKEKGGKERLRRREGSQRMRAVEYKEASLPWEKPLTARREGGWGGGERERDSDLEKQCAKHVLLV